MQPPAVTATPTLPETPPGARGKQAFAALYHREFRRYFVARMFSMMAHNIEHVITYWAIFQVFRSPALGGFAVISHWLPFLLFSVYAGALADRFDCRKIMHISQFTFMGVALAWGFLILTDRLEVWHAVVLLAVHGIGGTLWNPAAQLIIHEIVGPEDLQSAIRLNATTMQLGFLLGPAVGGGLLMVFGPAVGLLVNVFIYFPLTIWLFIVRYTGHKAEESAAGKRPRLGLRDALGALRGVTGNRLILSMVMLGGGASFFVGSAYQAQMPGFAESLGATDAGFRYSLLFAANAAGAVVGGVLLEGRGLFEARPRTAIISAALFSICIGGFAAVPFYAAALALLFLAGIFNLTFYSMALTLVQLHAPPHMRGSLIGLFNMAQLGLRTFSGFSVGVLGGFIGIHWSLGLSAAMLFIITMALLLYAGQRQTEQGAREAESATA